MSKPRVILADCPDYDPARIRAIVRAGLDALGDPPAGRVLVKPNGVIAHREFFRHPCTRAEFLDGVLGAVRDTARDMTELAVGERCGITVPTRMVFTEAGWDPVIRRHRAKRYFFEEEVQTEVRLSREPRLRDFLYTPEPVARADYFVNCPKFKAHPWTTVTFALKNLIGIQHDPDRLIDHDFALDDKIADLQEIVRQRFIAIDAIVGGQDRMLTPNPFELGMIVMGNNPVAVDATCCRILGLDPAGIGHIAAAHRKGFGPMDPDAIDVAGDLTLEAARSRARGFRTGLIRVENYFAGTKVTAHAGPPPAPGGDYCWGGCPGALEEAIEIVRQVDPRTDERMKPLTVVFGAYPGDLSPRPGEPVVFVGDCAKWRGEIAGQPVAEESRYRDRSTHNPHCARSDDIFVKMLKTTWRLLRRRGKPAVRIPGCPVSVAENALFLSTLGGTRNPYLQPATIVPFMRAYLTSMAVRAFKRLRGQRSRRPAGRPAAGTGP
ncbi:MAG: DUF362 domain-containing protein [Candidatus Sericytochromatia bacterium]|nr:DUF362 domain-containing protein [Candidatus Tanganyikabacteria bacterium]